MKTMFYKYIFKTAVFSKTYHSRHFYMERNFKSILTVSFNSDVYELMLKSHMNYFAYG